MTSTTLLKYLAQSGIGSRRKLADAIREERVRVNGTIAEDFKQPIHPGKDIVTLDGREVAAVKTETICLMLNKPAGVISTTSDERGRRSVIDLVPSQFRGLRIYPVGRLDRDTTGLLLLTNDGRLTHQLTHPSFEHEKEYLVAVDGTLRPRQRLKLEKGIELPDGRTSPARIITIRKKPPYNYSIIIHEGRNRQVHRMFEALGYQVLALKRVRMGKLRLGTLKEGEMREISPEEIAGLLSRKPKRSATPATNKSDRAGPAVDH